MIIINRSGTGRQKIHTENFLHKSLCGVKNLSPMIYNAYFTVWGQFWESCTERTD